MKNKENKRTTKEIKAKPKEILGKPKKTTENLERSQGTSKENPTNTNTNVFEQIAKWSSICPFTGLPGSDTTSI